MSTVFFGIYDDTSRPVPFKIHHLNPITIYRTANMGFVEELSGLGFEPTAILLEEDIAELKNGTYANESISEKELKFLQDTVHSWSLKD